MSQRFIRCRHCGFPHVLSQTFCPATGGAIRSAARKTVERAAAPIAAAIQAPPSSRRPPRRVLIGTTIDGKYLVRSILGEGGMGTVFEAEHVALGRSVAVKVLHTAQAARKDSIRRFQQEARAAGAIGHPNICGVTDLGALDDGSPYMVMERLVGETLAERIASEGGLPFDDVIDILVQVLSGLVAAHGQRIVHRDIKPENVFLTTRVGCAPLVKVLDFGVSKMTGDPSAEPVSARREELALTRTGMVMGTPYYMAPEQARGERDLDARVDLYACGVILYEALTGKRPFTAENYNALLLKIVAGSPRSACELRPALPASYAAVIEKAMARNPVDRYATAADFQHDLKTLRERSARPGPTGASPGAQREANDALRRPSGEFAANLPATPGTPAALLGESVPADVSSSSVEIPVIEASDTSETGLLAVDPTEVHQRAPEGREGREVGAVDDEDGDDGDPTLRMSTVKPRPR